MQMSDVNNDKIMFSLVDEIVDDTGKKYLVEVKLTKTFFKRLINHSNENFIINLKNNFSVTKREAQVLTFLAQGKNNVQIAENMNVSVHTAKAHIQNIFKKLSVNDRTEAVVKAIKDDLIEI